MSERFLVREDCLGWTTVVKKGVRIGDANAKVVPLARGTEVTLEGPGLLVAPMTLFVTLGETTIEVRRASLVEA